jgi:hypothetical protein
VRTASRLEQTLLIFLGAVVAAGALTVVYLWDVPFLPV